MNYDEFNQYLQQSVPEKDDKILAWKTSIGLQKVDGLSPSEYLLETAKRHIDGEISIDDVCNLIDSYYENKNERDDNEDGTEEADKVSANITKLLSEQTFSFSPAGLAAIHKRIFDGVFSFAGTFRNCNITKKEWVLRGETVLYVSFEEITLALEYDFNQEKEFSYKNLSCEEMVNHFSKFISNIWQIHPFREGNTRTTAVFAIKYLRAMGFSVTNELFSEHSWYFRNALVRANYRNYALKIESDLEYIERFFRNLLLGESNELKNRFLVVNLPKELTPQADPTSTPQASRMLSLGNPFINKLILVIGNDACTLKFMMEQIGLSDRKNFLKNYLKPAINNGFVRLQYPKSPRHPNQKYLLTEKGSASFLQLKS